jgi:undecaprenyl-diphosphatase
MLNERVLRITLGIAGTFAVSLAAVVGLGLVLERAFIANGATAIDARVTRWFVAHRTETLTTVMRAVTWLGSSAVIIPTTVIIVTVLVVRHRVVLGVFLGITVAGASLLSTLAKEIVGRDRPPASLRLAAVTSPAFPSGHATQAAATYLALAVIVSLFVRRARPRIVIWAAAILIIALVGVSRVYLGVHWATDVLGGWLLGGLWVTGLTVSFQPLER